MFKDIDWSNEDEFYDRVLTAWNEAHLTDKEADMWLCKFVMDVVQEDRRLRKSKQKTLARVLTNALILALALTNKKPADLRGVSDIAELPPAEREKVLREIAALIEQ
ncbi:MAG: hypothetical protein RBG13Loki_0897 [Promethearchaeota archaeon CR_4]|nr:MAG: hypothetical protein RBG13Loki_0897 [Candidatus Lokiarchaeota archaeon CR_4]